MTRASYGFPTAVAAIAAVLLVGATAARTDTVPPIRPEQMPSPAASPRAHAEKKAAERRAPTARCNDGTSSRARDRAHACARHGGVKEWLAR